MRPARVKAPASSPHPGPISITGNCMATLENAIRIASVAHEGQSDEAGQPCLLHPLRVMAAVEGEASQIVAVLHDVLKSARIKADDLRGEGFDDEILEALESITPRESEPYTSYILRCRINDLARKVKLAELVDNLQPSRLVLLPRAAGAGGRQARTVSPRVQISNRADDHRALHVGLRERSAGPGLSGDRPGIARSRRRARNASFPARIRGTGRSRPGNRSSRGAGNGGSESTRTSVGFLAPKSAAISPTKRRSASLISPGGGSVPLSMARGRRTRMICQSMGWRMPHFTPA